MDVANKVLLITGGSSGIGATTAKLAIQAGYRVAVAARADDRMKALKTELADNNVLFLPCAIDDWDSQKSMFEQVIAHFGKLDAVYANAGVLIGAKFVGGEDTPDAWRDMVMTNVFGAASTARLALPELIKTKGHLILTGSVAGRFALPGSLYSATKWAITGMAENIRQQLIGTGVRVTLILPGLVDTPLYDTPFYDKRPEGPVLEPHDIGSVVMYALSQPPHVDINEIIVRPVGQPM